MAKIIVWIIVIAIAIRIFESMSSWPWWVWIVIVFVLSLIGMGINEKEKEERETQEAIDRMLLAEETVEEYILTSGDIEAINILKIARENPDKFFSILNGGREKGNKTLENAIHIYSDIFEEVDAESEECDEEEYKEEQSKNNHQNNSIEDCFSVLEIPSDSSASDIKSAYRKKMAEYHPDKVFKLGDKLKKIANEESKRINIAYSMLKDMGYV